jgi:hypothetical protein
MLINEQTSAGSSGPWTGPMGFKVHLRLPSRNSWSRNGITIEHSSCRISWFGDIHAKVKNYTTSYIGFAFILVHGMDANMYILDVLILYTLFYERVFISIYFMREYLLVEKIKQLVVVPRMPLIV